MKAKIFKELTTFGLDSCWYENFIRKNLPLDLTPVGAKTSDPKTLTLLTDLSKIKEKVQKEYIPEDLESEPSLSDSSSSESDSSYDKKIITS